MSPSFNSRLRLAFTRSLTMMASKRAVVAAFSVVLLLALARPAAAAEIIQIPHNRPDLNAFMYIGPMLPGDDLKLLKHLSGLPKKRFTTAYLYSGGGSLDVGLEIGRVFRDQKIRTVVQPIEGDESVLAGLAGILKDRNLNLPANTSLEDYLRSLKPGMCASACALAFLGGTDSVTGKPWRTKAASARLGFHSFRTSFDPGKIYTHESMSAAVQLAQRVAFDVISYMQDIDLSLRFVPVMFKVESADMNWISNREALLLGINVWDDQLPKDQGFIPSDRIDPAGGIINTRCPVEPQ